MRFFVVGLLLIVSNAGAQNVTIQQLGELFDGHWYSTLDTQQILRDIEPSVIVPIAESGCLFLGQGFDFGTPPAQHATISGCYDLITGEVVGGIPYNHQAFQNINTRPQPKTAIGGGWHTHFLSNTPGGNPNPTGGDTIVAFDNNFNFIGRATVDGDLHWVSLFPNATQPAVIDPHDYEAFSMNNGKYLTFTIARKEITSNGQNYLMQGVAVYRLDTSQEEFYPIAFYDMDGQVNFGLIDTMQALDIMHPNELDVFIYEDSISGMEKAYISVSNRNTSTIWLYDFIDNQTTSLLPHKIIGEPFPSINGNLPFHNIHEDDFPLNLQHGSVMISDDNSGLYVYSNNNGSIGVNPFEMRQASSYVAYHLTDDTIHKLSSHSLSIGGDSIFSVCCGGTSKLVLDNVLPVIVFWAGSDMIESDFFPGFYQFIESSPAVADQYHNFIWMIPPPYGNWDTVLTFHLPVSASFNNRNLGNFIYYDQLPDARNNTIEIAYDNGNTLMWCPDIDVWSINNQIQVTDTLSIPGIYPVDSIRTHVSAWAKDSLYLWKVQNWSDNPILVSDNEIEFKNQFTIYPNPTTGNVVISSESPTLSIFDISGQLVKTLNISEPRQEANLNMAPGIYFISSGMVTQKLIVK